MIWRCWRLSIWAEPIRATRMCLPFTAIRAGCLRRCSRSAAMRSCAMIPSAWPSACARPGAMSRSRSGRGCRMAGTALRRCCLKRGGRSFASANSCGAGPQLNHQPCSRLNRSGFGGIWPGSAWLVADRRAVAALELDLHELPVFIVPDILRKGRADHVMMRALGAALHDDVVFAAIGYRDRHDRAVLRVQGDRLAEQCGVPVAGGDRRPGDLGHLAVGVDGDLAVAARRLDAMWRPIVVGYRFERHKTSVDPALGLGLIEAVNRHEGDLDLNARDHPRGRLGAVAAELDRVAANGLAVAHDREADRLRPC